MTEPLDDLEPIKKRRFSQYEAVDDRLALLAEVERLRGELADRANVEADLRAQLAEMQQRIERAGPSLRLSTTRAVLAELAHREGIDSKLREALGAALTEDIWGRQ